jgi:hypothetical protein
LTVGGAGAAIFGSSGSWTQSTGTLVLTVAGGQSLPTGSNTVITFTLTNSASVQSGKTVSVSSSTFATANATGSILNTVATYNVTTRDTEANILASTPSNPSGEVTNAYGTDTYDLYVWDGSAWYIYREDFMSPIFDGQLTFPTIQVFDNESDFISDIGAPDYTIVHAKDTDKLYVWDGSAWVIYNQN